ncbi:MAG: AAA family ATPase [Chloroflexota bacterium]
MYLFMFSGVPASGKSTIAKAVATHYKLPYFSRDNTQRFLYQRGLVSKNTVDGYLWMLEMGRVQLSVDVGCVLDAVFGKQGFRYEAQAIAEQFGAQFVPVYCYCSDETLWKSRWHQRAESNHPAHWNNPTWADVERIASNFESWLDKDVIYLDAVDNVEVNMAKIVDMLACDNSTR